MIVFSEASADLDPDKSDGDINGATRVAVELGGPVYFLSRAGAVEAEDEEDPLAHVPAQPREQPAVWIGHIPTPERYARVYAQALARGIRLINSPDAHRRALEFDGAYPRLAGLTPRSVVVDDVQAVKGAVETLGLPVFIKGSVLSRKAYGWKACVAETREEAEALVGRLLRITSLSRGRAVLRELVHLRRTEQVLEGFPTAREYRLFLLRGEVVGSGYYWPFADPFGPLGGEDEAAVHALAREAARRMEVPYLSVDVGQREDGGWTVIEVGDPQFAGVGHISVASLYRNLRAALAPG
jgi:hypothetical protein